MAVGWGWGNDYPSSSNFFVQQFTGPGFASQSNASLVGALPDQLRGWGYTVTTVPNVDERVAECVRLIGGAQSRCWTELDQYLSEEVVPFVPIYAESYIEVVPARVTQYSFDQAFDLPALDHIGVTG
jgi:hypothetical protein